jgi:hypothetical protein
VVAAVSGEVDAAGGTVVVAAVPPSGAQGAQASIPVVQDGVPGQGPRNTIELVTERTETIPGGCGTVPGFEGDVRVRSFFAGWELRDVYLVIDTLTPSGREACNSAPPLAGLSAQNGLFSYGTLVGDGASAVATWRFKVPDATQFRFTGRVVADIVDAAPPVTSATPAAGLFDAAVLVSLACADAGSGCAATHYSVDGTEPTAASPVATAPIAIGATTTIRFFSVDVAGNAEASRSLTYVVDTLTPAVVSVEPRDGQGDVATSAVVRVTFNEAMDPATVPGALTVTGPGGPVAGTVAPETGNGWAFTPAAPLEAGTRYAVAVSSAARDPVGRGLAAGSTSWFVTVTSPVVVSGPGSANLVNRGTAEDANGNRLAVFSANTWAGAKVLWSYSAAGSGTWSTPQALYSGRTIAPPELPVLAKVVASGSRFLVAWQNPQDGALESAVFDAGTPGAVTKHWRLRYENAPVLDAVGNGSGGFALVGSDSLSDRVYGAVHNGTSWSYVTGAVDSGIARASAPVVASMGGSAYVAAYLAGNPPVAVYTSRYTFDGSLGRWTAALLPGASGTATMLAPAISASATRVCVGWATQNTAVYASVDAGTGFGAGQSLGTAGWYSTLSAAARGDRCAVTWDRSGATYESSGGAYPYWYWTGGRDLTTATGSVTSGAVVAPANDGFVAALRMNAASGAPSDVRIDKAGATTGFNSATGLLAESWAEDLRDLVIAGRAGAPALLSWTRDEGAAPRIEAKTYDGTTLGAEELVSGAGVPGSASTRVRLARNAAGDVVAVWHQDDGSASGVFAAFRRGGTWEPAFRLARRAVNPEVASNGTGFLVLYREIGTGTASNLMAIAYTGGAWGTPALLEANTDSHVLASDGTTYLAAWQWGGARVHTALNSAAGWGTVREPTTAMTASRPSVASARAGEYVVTFYLNANSTSRSVYSHSGQVSSGQIFWGSPNQVYAAGTGTITAGPVVAASAGSYAVVWGDSGAARAAVGPGATFGAVALIAPAASCTIARLAASASGWLAALECGGVRLVPFAAGAWGAVVQPGITSSELAVASDGSRYKVLARVAAGSSASVAQVDVSGGTAWPAATLASGTSPSVAPVQAALSVLHDGTDWVGAWVQQGDEPIANVVRARTAF